MARHKQKKEKAEPEAVVSIAALVYLIEMEATYQMDARWVATSRVRYYGYWARFVCWITRRRADRIGFFNFEEAGAW